MLVGRLLPPSSSERFSQRLGCTPLQPVLCPRHSCRHALPQHYQTIHRQRQYHRLSVTRVLAATGTCSQPDKPFLVAHTCSINSTRHCHSCAVVVSLCNWIHSPSAFAASDQVQARQCLTIAHNNSRDNASGLMANLLCARYVCMNTVNWQLSSWQRALSMAKLHIKSVASPSSPTMTWSPLLPSGIVQETICMTWMMEILLLNAAMHQMDCCLRC